MDESDVSAMPTPGADDGSLLTAHAGHLQAVAASLAMTVLFPDEFKPQETRAEARAQVAALAQSLVAEGVGIEQMLWAFASAWATDLCRQADAPNVRAKALAKRAADKKLERDPKQAAKATVRERWDRWQRGELQFDSASDFARTMVDEFEPVLKSSEVIEGWCSAWKKESVARLKRP